MMSDFDGETVSIDFNKSNPDIAKQATVTLKEKKIVRLKGQRVKM